MQSEARPEPLVDLGSGVVYLDLMRVPGARYDEVLAVLAAARALVIDARGYPTDLPMRRLPHLMDDPLRSPPFLVPVAAHPDPAHMRFVDTAKVLFEPALPRLTCDVAVIIDAYGTR